MFYIHSYLADNEANIMFGVLMSFWSSIFLSLWKQKQAVYQWEWDLTKDDYVDDALDHSSKTSFKQMTKSRSRIWRYIITCAAVFIMMFMMVAALGCVILIKVYVIEFCYNNFNITDSFSQVKLLAALASAGLNFTIISLLELLYPRICHYLARPMIIL